MDDGSSKRKRRAAHLLTLRGDYSHKHDEVGEVDSVPLRRLCISLKKMLITGIFIRRSKGKCSFYVSGCLALSYDDIQLILPFK